MAYQDDNFINSTKMVWNYSYFSSEEIKQFQKGKLFTAHEKFGSHYIKLLDTHGYYFAVWAPNATKVCVIGEFNGWKNNLHPLFVRLDKSGIWEGFIPHIPEGTKYKYQIQGFEGVETIKADPYAKYAELRPNTASITRNVYHEWNDNDWMQKRKKHNALNAPWSVYEVHLGSWMRPKKDQPNLFNTYLETAERLVPYVKNMGFTHVEFMPITEYPYDGSWGYQCTGFFSATSRYGTPEEFMQLIQMLHQNDIGVILDWVPSHFPADEHGLYMFDGTHTYEYADMRKGFHKDWNSYIFNYARAEVRSFLLSSAHYWLQNFHVDGLRVDAVNSIIRLDYSRGEGEWEPNAKGGNDNEEAISFLQEFNKMVYKQFEGVQTIAEEASDWKGITHPISKGGFGFGMKWMMGWMHDSFKYYKKNWAGRIDTQNDFTFSMMYFYNEKFMLPLSHDEIVHGKSPMLYKMPGYEYEKFANLKLYYSYMYMHPGAKLMFMGNEFGATNEWNYDSELQWELLHFPAHNGLQECVRKLNHLYKEEPALHELQFKQRGFEWDELGKEKNGIIIFRRNSTKKGDELLVILNNSNKDYTEYPIVLSRNKQWKEIFNSDEKQYWGSGNFVNNSIFTTAVEKNKETNIIKLSISAFSCIVLK